MNSTSRDFYLLHFRKILIIGSDVCHNRFLIGVIHIHVWKWEAVTWRCSAKKRFLKISQNSQENTCARVSFLIKVAERELQKRLWHRCFPVNFEKFYEHLFYRIPPVVPIPQTPMNAWKFCKIQSLFLMGLQKGDYGTDVFLWILPNFKNTFFYKTPLVALATSNTFDNWN